MRRSHVRIICSPTAAAPAATAPAPSTCRPRSLSSRPRRALDETGFCFLFAPAYHPGLKYAGPVRRALKVRTIMNVLGPCVNPAEPKVQLLGVADPALLEPVAETLAALRS